MAHKRQRSATQKARRDTDLWSRGATSDTTKVDTEQRDWSNNDTGGLDITYACYRALWDKAHGVQNTAREMHGCVNSGKVSQTS